MAMSLGARKQDGRASEERASPRSSPWWLPCTVRDARSQACFLSDFRATSWVLLLVLLGTGLLKARHVGDACDCLLDNMSLFFIPAGVAIMGCVSLLEGNALKFALVCVITTVIVFLATSYTVMLVSRLTAKRVDATGVARVADEEA